MTSLSQRSSWSARRRRIPPPLVNQSRPEREPDQRVKPVDRLREDCEPVDEYIQTLQMGDFVQAYQPQSHDVVGLREVGGKQDGRAEESEQSGRGEVGD